MTAAVGFPTLRLVRVALGVAGGKHFAHLRLEGLEPGQWRDLTPSRTGTPLVSYDKLKPVVLSS
jgi:16S rRNA U516 pseudouridylate synthase RsuA-like enzyme